MDESYIRNLPTEQLVNIRNKLKGVDIMSFEARVNSLENAVAKLIAMAEEEEKVHAEEEMKAEEEAVHKSEEEEKMQAEEKDRKEVPVTTVTAEEEDKVKALEDKVKQLTEMLQKKKAYVADDGAITPDTPEDEPAMKTVKIPPVKSGHVEAPKGEPKVPETPSMKPGKKTMKVGGMSASQRTETTFNAEEKAIDEILSFAASRGSVPVQVGRAAMVKRV